MTYRFFILFFLIFVEVSAFADNNNTAKADDLTKWAENQSGKDREIINGVRIFRPAESDGKQIVSDFFDIAGVDKDAIFTKAMLFAIDNLDKETEVIDIVESTANRFVVAKSETSGNGRDAMTFTYKLALQSADGILSFAAYDIAVDYKEKGILPRHLAFEKLKPAEKKLHKDFIEAFSFQNSKFLKEMVEFIEQGEYQQVTHWKEIENCEVVEGMTETEVKLSVGRPSHVRDSGDKVKWMIGYNMTVIFTDGKVSAVIK